MKEGDDSGEGPSPSRGIDRQLRGFPDSRAERIWARRVGTRTRLRIAFRTFDGADRTIARKEMIHQNVKLNA